MNKWRVRLMDPARVPRPIPSFTGLDIAGPNPRSRGFPAARSHFDSPANLQIITYVCIPVCIGECANRAPGWAVGPGILSRASSLAFSRIWPPPLDQTHIHTPIDSCFHPPIPLAPQGRPSTICPTPIPTTPRSPGIPILRSAPSPSPGATATPACLSASTEAPPVVRRPS